MSSTPKIPDLPDPGSTLESLTRFAQAVRELLQVREGRRGPAPEEGVTFRDLVDLGIVVSKIGGGWATGDLIGTPGPPGLPGPAGPPGTPYVPDYTAPPTPTGLAITTLTRGAYIEWDAPGYTQGHGNAYTKVYIAQRASMSDPAPVFADAVEAGRAGSAGTIYVHQATTGAIIHAWIAFVTNDGVESVVPAGGANGVSVTIGKIDGATEILAASIGNALIANLAVDDAKMASVSAAKLLAGAIAVGEDITSTNYVPGVAGWRIAGSGAAQIPALAILGQLVASQIDTRGLTIKDGAGTVIFSAGTPLTQAYADATLRNDYVPTGANLIYNSAFEAGLSTGWFAVGGSGGFTPNVGLNLSDAWRLLPIGAVFSSVLYMQQIGESVAGDSLYYEWGSIAIPVAPNTRYVLSAYVQNHRCTSVVFLRVYNGAGTLIQDGEAWAYQGDNEQANGNTLDKFARVQAAVLTAPTAAYVMVFIRKHSTNPFAYITTSSYTFVTRLQLEQATANSWASAWSDGARQHAINAANIGTYMAAAAIGDAYIANLHASKLFAGSITTDKIQVGQVSAANNSSYNIGGAVLSGTNYDSGVFGGFALPSTGAYVKVLGSFNIDGILNNTSIRSIQIGVSLYVNGGYQGYFGGLHAVRPVAGGVYFNATVPVTWRGAPAAGSNSYQIRIQLTWYDVNGNAVFLGFGTYSAVGPLMAEENKV